MTTKHIIIEGVDKCGKTTLAKFLSEKLKMPIKKFSAPDKNPFDEYINFLLNENTPHIIDRCYMSELAYGPAKRIVSYINHLEKQVLETAIMDSVTGIYCYDTTENIEKRFDTDGETFISKRDIDPIRNNYDQELETSLVTWLSYKIGDSMDFVAGFCKARQLK